MYRNRKYQATVVGLDSNLAPSDVLKRYQSEAKNNFPNYISEEYDEAFAKALNATDVSEKIKWYKDCVSLFLFFVIDHRHILYVDRIERIASQFFAYCSKAETLSV